MMAQRSNDANKNMLVIALSTVLFLVFFFWMETPIPKKYSAIELVVGYYIMLSFLFGYVTRAFIVSSSSYAYLLVIAVPLLAYSVNILGDILAGRNIRFEKPSLGISIMLMQLFFVLIGAIIFQRIKKGDRFIGSTRKPVGKS